MTQNLSKKQKYAMIGALLIGAFMGITNETLLATALPTIQGVFGVTQGEVQWLTTVFLMVNGIMIPISAYLIERFSTRKLFLTAISLFGLGTLIAALAVNFPMLLIARVVQASGSGIMLPLLMTVLLILIPAERRGRAMGLLGIVIAFGPAIGPTLSGVLLEFFSWRSLFIAVLPLVALAMTIAFIFMKNVTELSNPKFDFLSIVLSSTGFGAFLYGFGVASKEGFTSPLVIGLVVVGAVIITLFVRRQFKLPRPILEFRIFRYPIFTLSIGITLVSMVSLIGAETMLPLFVQNVLGYTPLQSGLMLMPGAIVIGIMSPIAGSLFDKYGAKRLAIPGFMIVVATTYFFTQLSMDMSFTFLTTIYAIRMFGLSLTLMPVMTAALNQIPSYWYAHGSAMANTLQQISASIGTALLITFVGIGTQLYSSNNAGSADVAQMAELTGFQWGFTGSLIMAAAALVLSFFLKPGKQAANTEVREEAS
ncbi:DHA2 family efflux MFS transporter permease subunit [Paenalkalicoccus suaedae]|uniref:DHA2 family efflux MFS transporter permease subunit n=1 Tax=Paenalkalicoccus suaedae TaxID=2592382 RepID=A0A859FIT2_9BACI|nr:DHA2 family efflux MFS transporter permease subunit [Paenalkalicoccus suaedae]QKS72714.1 DHA2 family efflux MFS transporter permease subunit [Paenalkalicoccus suaedae]